MIAALLFVAAALSPPGVCDEFPSLAPDQRTLVFDTYLEGGRGIFALDLVTAKRTRLTHQGAGVWDYWEQWDYAPAVSPDGRSIAYLHDTRDGIELRVMPIAGDGGEPRTLTRLANVTQIPAWRDAQTITVFGPERTVLDVTLDGRTHAIARVPSSGFPKSLITLPGGGTLASLGGLMFTAPSTLLRLDAQAATREVTGSDAARFAQRYLGTALSAHGDRLYYVDGSSRAGARLVSRPLDGGALTQVAGLEHPTGGFTFFADRRHLVYSACHRFLTLARVGHDARFDELLPRQEDDAFLRPLPLDAQRLVTTRLSGGHSDVMIFDLRTKAFTPLARQAMHAGLTAKRDAILISRNASTGGEPGIYVVTLDGKERRVTNSDGQLRPQVSADGKWIYFIARPAQTSGGGEIRRVPWAGGADELVVAGKYEHLAVSPKADRLLYWSNAELVVWEKSGTAKATAFFKDAPRIYYADATYSRDGAKVLFVRESLDLSEVAVAGPHTPKELIRFGRETVGTAAYADDGTVLVDLFLWDGGLFETASAVP